MKRVLTLVAVALLSTVVSVQVNAAVINIDFNGTRNNPGPDGPPGPTYVGVGAVGTGTFNNGLAADSRGPLNTDIDNITVAGSNLKDQFGTSTLISFAISPVGGDDSSNDPTNSATGTAALTSDYIFVHSSGANSDGFFTISGLAPGSIADLYFQLGGSPITITGVAGTGVGIVGANGLSYTEFLAVPAPLGSISGDLGNGGLSVLSGMTISGQSAVPEPGSLILLACGFSALIYFGRRRRSA